MWRSLVARFVRDEEVAGSNPVIPTRNITGLMVEPSGPFSLCEIRTCRSFVGAVVTKGVNMNRLKGLHERSVCFLVKFLRILLWLEHAMIHTVGESFEALGVPAYAIPAEVHAT